MTSLVQRSVGMAVGRTTMRLEADMWEALEQVCWREQWTEGQAVWVAQAAFPKASRTSAVRSYLLAYFRSAATEAGHATARHGPGR
jgi:predicted DNA-binding ribbon-helix-helix protein